MKIKICGLFRGEDIGYVNDAKPDYIGFVFAESRRRVTPARAARLRRRLAEGIIPAGVFVNASAEDIAALYRDGIINIAQLHGGEDEAFIRRLRETAGGGFPPLEIIKTIQSDDLEREEAFCPGADYYLVDSGAGGGRTFDWTRLKGRVQDRLTDSARNPWFLAGGIGLDNIERAMAWNPFAVDISSGAETEGIKDREKITALTSVVHGYVHQHHQHLSILEKE